MANHLFKVVERELLTDNILELHLRPEQPFSFSAGDYIEMGVQADELKPFSIACSPRQNGQIILQIKDHDHSSFMQKLFALAPGDEVIVKGPNKQYQLDSEICNNNQSIVLVAGGTGFSPMKALLDELLETDCRNPIHFYWGARHPNELYHRKTMIALAEHHANLNYIEVLSDDAPESNQRTGYVHQAVLADFNHFDHVRVFLCGPWPMQQAAKEAFLKAGLTETCFN